MLEEIIDGMKLLVNKVDHLTHALGFPVFEPIPQEIEEKIYSQKEAASELSVTPRQVRRYTEQGILIKIILNTGTCYKQSAINDCKLSLIEKRQKGK